ncbi:MAG: hypothetical protein HC859_12245, partial [Bacteroidia bacterium]|nr:hypothetical protein [Bacteroidia bacterium]
MPYADHEWDPDSVDAVLEHAKTQRNVDTDRVYVTGLSLGGSGVWIYAANHPDKVAAIVPISGKTNLAIDQACNLVDIPVWVFHGSEDNLLSTSFPIDMVNAINGCGDGHYAPELTFNQSRGHEGWNEIMNRNAQYEIYTWMLQFAKNDFTNRPPYVHVGSDFKVLQEDGATYIYG